MPVSTVPKTVLIIDDEPSIVDLLKDILGSANFRPIGVVKWTDAVDAIGHENPSLILLDLKMPTIDGPSLLEFLRKEGVDIPVIIVSGFITEEVAEDLKKLDVEAFVQKPFRAADIIAHVERVIGPAAEPPKVTPTAVDPKAKSTGQVSMTAFLSSADPGGNPAASNSPPAPSDESDVLAALSKLDKGSPSQPPAAKPAPASANSDTSDILNALQRHDTDTPAQPLPENPATAPPQAPSPPLPQPSANASPAPEEASSAAPPPAQPTRAVTAPPASAPVAPPFPDTVVGTPRTNEEESPRRERRNHHRRPPRRRRFTRRNVLLFVTCVAVASFMALMRWYASQVDIAEIQKQATESIRKEATKDILKELQK